MFNNASTRRIFAVTLRQWLYMRHNMERMVDVFYWPIIDLLLWGLTSQYLQSGGAHQSLVFSIVSGILLWIMVNRTQYEIGIGLLAEMWDGNLVNMFSTPLQFHEWILGTYLVSFVKTMLGFVFASVAAYIMYKTNIFVFGWYIIPMSCILVVMGWAIGTLVSSLLFFFGTKAQSIVWVIIPLLSPFSAIFYPISALPTWAQLVSHALPTSYVFENARLIIGSGTVNWTELVLAFGIAVVYLCLSLVLLQFSFQWLLKRGLLRNY